VIAFGTKPTHHHTPGCIFSSSLVAQTVSLWIDCKGGALSPPAFIQSDLLTQIVGGKGVKI